jgi:hypothetical protein
MECEHEYSVTNTFCSERRYSTPADVAPDRRYSCTQRSARQSNHDHSETLARAAGRVVAARGTAAGPQ